MGAPGHQSLVDGKAPSLGCHLMNGLSVPQNLSGPGPYVKAVSGQREGGSLGPQGDPSEGKRLS